MIIYLKNKHTLEVDDFKLNVFLAEMGILTDAVTVTEEICLFFDQFMVIDAFSSLLKLF